METAPLTDPNRPCLPPRGNVVRPSSVSCARQFIPGLTSASNSLKNHKCDFGTSAAHIKADDKDLVDGVKVTAPAATVTWA
ncbi:hypothetical protein PtA15_13A201 [Puccinia triticina]|uniref:Uncharacterized protein n=1 Tax=Puccinia triticina TaxID=208348 RepID=A0ABY7D284_9BASI|nr:uncharacterized protein PtA15_13A201 [Puccinia triticina]WAQ90802.1 hypothetical protein PtA15_13A201 [Puccinia triticina]